MTLQRIFLAALLAVALAAGWRYRDAPFVHDLLYPPDMRPANIQFDNGSVRDALAASAPEGPAQTLPAPAGGMRKCVRGTAVSYTDRPCPAGFKEQTVAKGTVTVVPGQTAAPATNQGGARNGGVPNARDMLLPPGGEAQNLKDKRMERVIGN